MRPDLITIVGISTSVIAKDFTVSEKLQLHKRDHLRLNTLSSFTKFMHDARDLIALLLLYDLSFYLYLYNVHGPLQQNYTTDQLFSKTKKTFFTKGILTGCTP